MADALRGEAEDCRASCLQAWELRLLAYEQKLQAWDQQLRDTQLAEGADRSTLILDMDLRLGGRSQKQAEEAVELDSSSEPSTSSQTPRIESHNSADDVSASSSTPVPSAEAASYAALSPEEGGSLRSESQTGSLEVEAADATFVSTPRCMATPTDTPWGTPRGQHHGPAQVAVPVAWARGAPMASQPIGHVVPAPRASHVAYSGLATAPATASGAAPAVGPCSKTARDRQGVQQTDARCIAWYRVAFCGGMSVRASASADAPLTGFVMPCGVVFGVSDARRADDGRLYLRLACGQGWVFDDSYLMPGDPSVVFVRAGDHELVLNKNIAEYQARVEDAAWHRMYGEPAYYEGQMTRDARPRRYLTRGCRGGARRNKNKKQAEASTR